MSNLDDLRTFLDNYETTPRFAEMPRRTLRDKGANGPTSAHVIEEVHTPLNLAYISVTTGSTAFQNITGVTYSELPLRIKAGRKALEMLGIKKGSKLLITYPPLVNVFCKEALEDYTYSFLERSCRNALLWAMCGGSSDKPDVVIGESSFIRTSLEDAARLGLIDELRKDTMFLAAGTPLDRELPALVDKHAIGEVHDLYGCQEYGWLTLDGFALREDISLVPSVEKEGYFHFIVGGLPTGDCFPIIDSGHMCGGGDVLTYSCFRTKTEPEATITHTTANNASTVYKLAKTVLRIKGKILRVSPDLVTGAEETRVAWPSPSGSVIEIVGPDGTLLIDALLDAQLKYQSQDKKDPAWTKER